MESHSGSQPAGKPHLAVAVNGGTMDCQIEAKLSDMLGVTCARAAFSENLYVWAYHTNGSMRLYEYDTSAVAAIAVEPKQ